jgi:hypothetical protein
MGDFLLISYVWRVRQVIRRYLPGIVPASVYPFPQEENKSSNRNNESAHDEHFSHDTYEDGAGPRLVEDNTNTYGTQRYQHCLNTFLHADDSLQVWMNESPIRFLFLVFAFVIRINRGCAGRSIFFSMRRHSCGKNPGEDADGDTSAQRMGGDRREAARPQ